MAGRKRGRPSKLSPQIVDRLCYAIENGNYLEDACCYAGIDYSTFRRWMIRGEGATRGEYREFYKKVKAIEASMIVELVGSWRAKMDSWQSIAAFLERRFPEKFGRRRVEIMGEGGGPIELELAGAKASLEEKLARLLRHGDGSEGD